MILKASQRGGANQLSAHLLNERDNEHVRVIGLRGFVADNLTEALFEASAIARGTKCKQFLFSLSLNPPKGVIVSEADFTRAVEAVEKRLGLTGQPRAIILHEKEGRRHAHAVWSRIDVDRMTAVPLPFFKTKLTALSRDLFLDHGWTLPDGLRTHGGKSPLNFSLEEWQHAKRIGRDPREIKDAIRDAWARSDDVKSLGHALDERGYFLAQGDRRGYVVIDTDGETYSLARWAGIKSKDVRAKLGEPDALPSVTDTKAMLQRLTTAQAHTHIATIHARHRDEAARVAAPLGALVRQQRHARVDLDATHSQRWEAETQQRAARFRTGLAGLWDSVTGRRRALRRANEQEAAQNLLRDRKERDALAERQFAQRRPYQFDIDRTRKRHMAERALLARELAAHRARLRTALRQPTSDLDQPRDRNRSRGTHSLDL